MTPEQPLTVTLTAAQWNQMLDILYNVAAPHRVTNPLVVAIQQQCMRQDEALADNVTQLHEAGC